MLPGESEGLSTTKSDRTLAVANHNKLPDRVWNGSLPARELVLVAWCGVVEGRDARATP